MTLRPTVSFVSAEVVNENIHQVTMNLRVNDGTANVIDKNFSFIYKSRSDDIARITAKLRGDMQVEIDTYKSHDQILDKAAISDASTQIQNDLVM